MKRIIAGMLLLCSLASASTENCQSNLVLHGGFQDVALAKMYCTSNSSVQFTKCQNSIFRLGGVRPETAALFCIQDSSDDYVRCVANGSSVSFDLLTCLNL